MARLMRPLGARGDWWPHHRRTRALCPVWPEVRLSVHMNGARASLKLEQLLGWLPPLYREGSRGFGWTAQGIVVTICRSVRVSPYEPVSERFDAPRRPTMPIRYGVRTSLDGGLAYA